MELRHLRYLIAVAEEQSFVAAAARLQLAQPALSRQIRDLESEIGVDLFIRDSRGTKLSAAGDVCVRTARTLLDDVRAAIERARLAEHGLVGQCVLGATKYAIWNGLLARVVDRARAEYPGIQIIVEERSAHGQWKALAEAVIDVGFGTAPPSEFMQFTTETHSLDVVDGIAVAHTHHLATRASVTLDELQSETLVVHAPAVMDEPTRNVQLELNRRGFAPANTRHAANTDSLRMLVRAGAGWTPLPRSLRASLSEGMVGVPLDDFAVPFRYVHMHRRGENRPVVNSVIRAIRRTAAHEGLGGAMPEPPSGIRELAASAAPGGMSKIELRHLRYFAAIVEHETIGRAAEHLDLTQPALSRQLRDLEDVIGVSLLTRTARGVVPTLAGESLYSDALRIVRCAGQMNAEAQRVVRGASGSCVVGVVASPLVWDTITTAVADCAARLPNIDITVEDVPTPLQAKAVREARLDIAIGHRYPTAPELDPNIAREMLLPDEMNYAIVGAAHSLAHADSVSIHDLAATPFLFMKRAFSPALHDFVMTTFERAKFTPRIESEYDGLPTVWALAAQGLGWCFGMKSQREFPPHGCKVVRITDLHIPWGCELVHRRDESRSAVLSVIDAITRAASAVRDASMTSQETKYWPDEELTA